MNWKSRCAPAPNDSGHCSRLAQRLLAIASWRRVGLVLLADVAFSAALSWFESRVKGFSGEQGFPDVWLGFNASALYERLEAFEPEGRRLYFFAELVDLGFALAYATFVALILALSARALLDPRNRWRVLCLLPYVAAGFDYLENASFFTVLLAWPARLSAVAALAGAFNVIKWAVIAVTVLLAVVGIAGMGFRVLRKRLWTISAS